MNQNNPKAPMTFIDLNTIHVIYLNPKKAWHEFVKGTKYLCDSLNKVGLKTDEANFYLNVDIKNKQEVPDKASVERIQQLVEKSHAEGRNTVPESSLLNSKRLAAMYLFSIGSQNEAIDILNEVLSSTFIQKKGNTSHEINLMCLRDSVRLNQASIFFWLGDYIKCKKLLDIVKNIYENENDEMFKLKMADCYSRGLVYLAWIFAKNYKFEEAENSFLLSYKTMKNAKRILKQKMYMKEIKEDKDEILNFNKNQIFIYDQLINFYTFTDQIAETQQPLFEILKIMDKNNFKYDFEIGPPNHVYYYVTAILHTLKKDLIDFSKCLHYLFNIINVMIKNSDSFEAIPRIFYEKIFFIIEIIQLSDDKTLIEKISLSSKNNKNNKKETLFNSLIEYFDEIIAIFDEEKKISLHLDKESKEDDTISIGNYIDVIKKDKFINFNYLKDISSKVEAMNKSFNQSTNIDEAFIFKILSEKMLFKFANSVNDLEKYEKSIFIEGLNGFLFIEKNELTLYSICNFDSESPYEMKDIDINSNSDFNFGNKSHEIIKNIQIKNVNSKFAPFYFKKTTYKLLENTKFKYFLYFYLIAILNKMKLLYPLISVLSISIDELSNLQNELKSSNDQNKSESYLELYEFLLLLQSYLLISQKNYDRALYQLVQHNNASNPINKLFMDTMQGVCLSKNLYLDYSIYKLCEAYHIINPFVDKNFFKKELSMNKKLGLDKTIDSECKFNFKILVFLFEMRAIKTFLINSISSVLKLYLLNSTKISMKTCYRCKEESLHDLKTTCLKCKRAMYCGDKCRKKNSALHSKICEVYDQVGYAIVEIFKRMMENKNGETNFVFEDFKFDTKEMKAAESKKSLSMISRKFDFENKEIFENFNSKVVLKSTTIKDDEEKVFSEATLREEEDEVFDLVKTQQKISMKKGRKSVSAEVYGTFNQKKAFVPKVIPKNEAQKNRILGKVSQSFLFNSLDDKELATVIDAFEEKLFKKGEQVIKQGDQGDCLYLLEIGSLNCFKTFTKEEGDKLLKVYKPGEAFGELALLYNAPRAATIIANEDCILWALDRETFNNIVKDSAVAKREKYYQFLKTVEIFKSVQENEMSQICDAIQIEKFKKGDFIIHQDELGDKFYIIEEGEATATKVFDKQWEGKVVKEYKQGDYFGELALIKNEPRAASITAKSNCILLSIDRQTFKRLLGSLEKILQRNSDDYLKYINVKLDEKTNQINEEPDSLKIYERSYTIKDDEEKVQSEPESDADEEEEDTVAEMIEIKKAKMKAQKGRKSVSAEVYGSFNQKKAFVAKVIPKNEAQKNRILGKVSQSFLFNSLDDKELATVIDAFEEKLFKKDDFVIKQGDQGDCLYLLETGTLNCFKTFVKEEGDKFLKVYKPGEAFGELSLLYNAPRAATIIANEDCILWALDRETFNNIVKEAAIAKRKKYYDFLKTVEIFKSVQEYEMSQICDAMISEKANKDDYIIRQNEPGDKFYIVEEGEAQAIKVFEKGWEGKVVKEYIKGGYFGELALIKNEPRAASVVARTDCRLLSIDRLTFKRLLGPLEKILKRNSDEYIKYVKK